MKKGLLIIWILTLMYTTTWGQQLPQCDVLKTASTAFCQKGYDLSLSALLQFQKEFPNHELIEEVNQKIGHLYFLKEEYDIAKSKIYSIINGQNTGQENIDYNALECKMSFDSISIKCMKIVYSEPYVHLQHWACLDLYEIFKNENQLDSALKYLKLADKEYKFNYFCGNGNNMKAIQIALLYKDIYLAKGNIIAAINQLTNEIFAYESGSHEIRKSLKELLTSKYTNNQLNIEINQAIDNLYKKETERDNRTYSWFEIQLFGQAIRIPMMLLYWIKDGKTITIDTIALMQDRLRNDSFLNELTK